MSVWQVVSCRASLTCWKIITAATWQKCLMSSTKKPSENPLHRLQKRSESPAPAQTAQTWRSVEGFAEPSCINLTGCFSQWSFINCHPLNSRVSKTGIGEVDYFKIN